MPQYRKLATKTLESFDFNGLDNDFSRLTWCLLPLVACREGRGIDIPTWLIGRLYPLREDVTPAMIEAAMADFAAHGMVMRYSVAGRRYFQIVNWTRYQGATDKEAPSPYPAPELVESCAGVGRELVGSKSASDADADADADAGGEAERGASAPPPAPTPTPSLTFQDVSPAVKEAKRKRGDPVPSAAVANAPPIAALLHKLTSYWPGADVVPALVERFGDSPDESALSRAVDLWRLSGHKVNNWLGIADWYDEIGQRPGWQPQDRFKNGNGRQVQAAPPVQLKEIAPGLY